MEGAIVCFDKKKKNYSKKIILLLHISLEKGLASRQQRIVFREAAATNWNSGVQLRGSG